MEDTRVSQGFLTHLALKNKKNDFQNKSIYDASVSDCLKDIIDKFKPTNNFNGVDLSGINNQLAQQLSLPNLVLDLFNNSADYGLKFEVVPPMMNSQLQRLNARTLPRPNEGMVHIQIGSNYVNAATDLAIARTVIHELVHAYIYFEINTNPGGSIDKTLKQLIEQSGTLTTDPQHHLVATGFVDAMESALVVWHDSPNTEAIVYEYLIWSGAMRDSSSFLPFANSHATDPAFNDNSDTRNKIESGIQLSGGGLLPAIGFKSCL